MGSMSTCYYCSKCLQHINSEADELLGTKDEDRLEQNLDIACIDMDMADKLLGFGFDDESGSVDEFFSKCGSEAMKEISDNLSGEENVLGVEIPGNNNIMSEQQIPSNSMSGEEIPGTVSGEEIPGNMSDKQIPGNLSGEKIPCNMSGEEILGNVSGEEISGSNMSEVQIPGGNISAREIPDAKYVDDILGTMDEDGLVNEQSLQVDENVLSHIADELLNTGSDNDLISSRSDMKRLPEPGNKSQVDVHQKVGLPNQVDISEIVDGIRGIEFKKEHQKDIKQEDESLEINLAEKFSEHDGIGNTPSFKVKGMVECKACNMSTDAITTSCQHIVCRVCTLEWWKKCNTCPECGDDLGWIVSFMMGCRKRNFQDEDELLPPPKKVYRLDPGQY